jgi:hypothetical protein
MNGYIRAILTLPLGLAKISFLKLFHPHEMTFESMARISRYTEITMDFGATLIIGR